MRLFRKKEPVVVDRRQRFSYLVPTWFRSQERCDSRDDINATDVDGMTRLHTATTKGCSSTVQKLLQEGADVNSRISVHVTDAGYTPLHCAAREGSADIVKLLLKNNAQVDSQLACGLTPLHVAAERGNVPIAEILLNHGASINSECTRDSEIRIPLHFALKERHLGMVKLLLTTEATRANNAETQKKYSETTIRLACRSEDFTISAYVFVSLVGHHKKSNKMFLLDAVNGSEMEYTNVARRVSRWIFSGSDRIDCGSLLPALLHSAAEIGYAKIVKDFLKWGLDVHKLHHPLHPRSHDGLSGFTLLHTTARSSHVDLVKLLMNHGADVNVRDSNQKTPIFFAIEGLDVKMTKLLLSYGANIDADNCTV